ncbi:UDP-N-acetylmuramoyl-L-alanyl-D-glutamate--2,6-diaminopimelate ligase [Psychrobacter sanguinis]|uniref:UDP-N-acetylmuramoyl-L-alanyl-D-glutamate--2, 6-diaminopimelate ligase n=1 Tax=Psychrobacter sanguinis TaxID=861445 RepID=UPI00020C7E17|nr:UDP-N-acetylmuramoyl-L-alanyl-D-glutamate--2,6-diaminopimelate ligase [Psychrobacter sanguinis]EGK13514.1 UDP-N-acetylmuramoylalanyl-D-glutamate--2,6-diaminopimelate ligase [Psychrobacter sp. 1501(2011)]MCD9150383.1 UDP-N-acetylmuramoyl-L-alanyl-D-glutamate--2,6-diaminopimelate ligase [Psychrobacter sanguinis]
MTTNQSASTDNEASALTLRQVVETALKVLPEQAQTLQQILSQPGIDIAFSKFVLDSRQLDNEVNTAPSVAAPAAFVLLKSHTQPIEKSQQYAQVAAEKAAFILTEIDPQHLASSTQTAEYACPIIFVANLRDILGSLIQISLLPPASLSSLTHSSDLQQQLPQVIAVTGTNGKTTISQLIAQLCQFSNVAQLQNSAVMGTAGNGRLDSLVQASHTTGDALAVQRFLRQMHDEGVSILALEASSHGLDQQRLQAVLVTVAVYTNLSRDHLDYHPDMEDYARAKARLFDTAYFPQLTHAVINADDEFASLMAETARRSGAKVWLYSLRSEQGTINEIANDAYFVANKIEPSLEGVKIEVETSFGPLILHSPLLGRFNVANLLAAVAGVMALGIELEDLPALVTKLQGASGRMQRVNVNNDAIDDQGTVLNQGVFIVDYAHTPDALTQVLTSLKSHCSGNLWAIFGCGGDRDKGKRPLMAQAGLAVADKVVLTSDNPRSEDPAQILEDMQQGMSDEQHQKTKVIADRKQAIQYAVEHAGPQDIVVIAGKGHETYQEIKGVRYDFDDREVLQHALIEANKR